MRFWVFFFCVFIYSYPIPAQDISLGRNGPLRNTWDVLHYDLNLDFDLSQKAISGTNTILFRTLEKPVSEMQLDLQTPMAAQGFEMRDGSGKILPAPTFQRIGNHYILKPAQTLAANQAYQLICTFSGMPRVARNAPWDGGFIWKEDSKGRPWIAVACQGDGASLWFPCKDFQADEPDSGATIRIRNSENLPVISNGQLISGTLTNNPVWQVKSSINPYNITFYIGDYVGWKNTFNGISGKLPLSFYALRENEAKARKQFAVAPQMLRCFEEKVGPYPFYKDGYKLVEAPYLGMEHQSAVAYGNGYKMGYLGKDRSGTGIGKTFDYIIIHESGHEWFGNSITAADVADNWIHEGFTTWLESVFVECISGKKDALRYLHGERKNISNDRPIIGDYGVFDEGSGDRYDKGATIIGMLRALHPDDETFWQHFRKFYARFAHSTITSAEVEAFWGKALGRNLQPFFDQYLRTTDIPELELIEKGSVHARLKNIQKGFSLPLFYDETGKLIEVDSEWVRVGKHNKPLRQRNEFLVKE